MEIEPWRGQCVFASEILQDWMVFGLNWRATVHAIPKRPLVDSDILP